MKLQRDIPSLDGLRALAIICVIISHLSVNIYHTYSTKLSRIGSVIQILFLVGHLGVLIFFVISGFLITTLLLREQKISLARFYFRRTLRIFPPYYTYLIIFLSLDLMGLVRLSWWDFLSAFTYTANYTKEPLNWYLTHCWSLAVEEQFYLVFPLLLLLAKSKRTWLLCLIGVLLVCPLWRVYYVLHNSGTDLEFARFDLIADSLAVGCLLAGTRAWLHQQSWYQLALQSKLQALAPMLALLITWLARFPHYCPPILYVGLAITIQNLCLAFFLDCSVTNATSRAGQLLNSKPVVFVGIISYSLYLWQQPFLNPELPLPLIAKITLPFMVGIGSYYFVEQPSLRFRQYLIKKRYEQENVGLQPTQAT